MTETVTTPQQTAVPWIGLPDLLRMSMKGIDLAPLGSRLIEYARQRSDAAEAMLDLSIIFQLRGNPAFGLAMQREALNIRRVFSFPAHREPVSLRLAVIVGPGDMMANSPVEFLLEHSQIAFDLVYVCAEDGALPELPPHDAVFVAVAESSENRLLLDKLALWLQHWTAPVFNRPEAIRRLSRDQVSVLLGGISGIELPRTVRVTRADLELIAAGRQSPAHWTGEDGFPVIVRPVDSHAGQGLEKLTEHAGLAEYLERQAGNQFYLSRFVEYRNADGWYRKYRIVLMRGVPHLCHLAISHHWMVHYLSAGMLDNPANRAEEAHSMQHFREEFAARHAAALAEIAARSGLDYLGIDCGESPDGRLLVFEIDSNMIVHDMDPPELFPYKAPHMHGVFAAFQRMITDGVRD